MGLGTDYCYAGTGGFWLCSGHSYKVLGDFHYSVGCLLARRMSAEQRGDVFISQVGGYDEGELAANRNAATEERGYHNTSSF